MVEWNAINRSRVFLGILLVSLVLIMMVSIIGSKQDQQFLLNTSRYKQGIQYVNSARYKEAITIFASLDPGFRNSPQVYYYTAFSYAAQKNYKQAAAYMYKAQEARPQFVTDANFLYEFGRDLYFINHYEDARRYLAKALTLTKDPVLIQKIVDLQKQIDAKS